MDLSFNIVELIENNPITKLSNTYQNKLLIKIKETFTNSDELRSLEFSRIPSALLPEYFASFYCFLHLLTFQTPIYKKLK